MNRHQKQVLNQEKRKSKGIRYLEKLMASHPLEK